MTSNDDSTHPPLQGKHESLWMETTSETAYDALDDDLEVDVAVIGGGIAGITTAAELKAAGKSVAVVERDRILEGVTGHTTAKLTALHGLIYDHLIEYFGEQQARQYAEANSAAIDHVESTVKDRDLDCNFERTPAYTYTDSSNERQKIEDEVDAAQQLDLPASLQESTDLTFEIEAAIRLDDQAQFHPRKYLLALAEEISGEEGYVFEGTTATDVEDGNPCEVSTDRGSITADAVVVATHFPVFDRARYYERLYPKRSYVLAVRLQGDPPTGMYYKPDDPYFSVRPYPAGEESMVLAGGQNHRTGHSDSTVDRYRNLEQETFDRLNVDEIVYRWSTQDFVSIDRVPFIGPLGPQSENVYTATGFGGWGMTNGVVAGMLLSELIVDGQSEWEYIYRPMRFNETASADAFLDHNQHDVKHYLDDYTEHPQSGGVESVEQGSGAVLDLDEGLTAVHRDEDGETQSVSAICSHMGCLVYWNDGERSWDCPCHGSRFDCDGSVLNGPANNPLSERELDE
ncbi:FAD-dependent oxidoreductase [Natrinema sp. 1APR25-10V2]|uniref:FAD-dependent oxidoreductase n=1 Tax=Natrinema sp. 1APR25-10V2 TaxID=2951081 RepID=UPI00287641BB|nr:FAD-dependent oxidoreductase [Natrinema sp. 1APR25-10V2]MDS0478114.1 FAD-dependent oxidoreductase [Natrinema sp. 1APR25-10V2]